MNIDYTVHIWKEGSQYVAHAMPLDIMSSGETSENARAAIREAVSLFLETAGEMGTLDDILDECGYEYQKNEWISPSWISVERQSLAVGV